MLQFTNLEDRVRCSQDDDRAWPIFYNRVSNGLMTRYHENDNAWATLPKPKRLA